MGAGEEGRTSLQAVGSHGRPLSRGVTWLDRHRLEEVRLAPKSSAKVPLPPGTCRPWCPFDSAGPWLPSGWVHT